MINFEPLISWPWAILIGVLLLLILSWQSFLIISSQANSPRKTVKFLVVLFFTLTMLGYIFQPELAFNRADKAILIYDNSISKERLAFWKDSLGVQKAQNYQKFNGSGNPIYLLGDDFSKEELLSFNSKELIWLSDPQSNQLTFLEWKGILRHGEIQSVYGSIHSLDSVHIKVVTQNLTLSEYLIEPNSINFKLDYPVSILGRNELLLIANKDTLGTINFFSYPKKPISFSFQFSFPDPEIRILTQYLKKKGNHVSQKIKVSKNAIISTAVKTTESLRFLMIDASQLKSKEVAAALESGASVFIMNLSTPAVDILEINQELKTSFKIMRGTSEESREVGDQLTAASFEFQSQLAQKSLLKNSIAIQQIGSSKVGVSMLKETFPIQIAGDSVRYGKIWDEILAAMSPAEQSNWSLMQPVFQDFNAQIELNQQYYESDFVKLESDSIFLQQSLINPFTKSANFVSLASGWIEIADSLEIYSYSPEEWPQLSQAKLKADFLKSRTVSHQSDELDLDKNRVSDWVWYVMILMSLTLLWAEPKIRS
jgi:hypothetical protein